MLTKFNNNLKSILFEQASDESKANEKTKILKYDTNEFFIKFLNPIAIDAQVSLTKQANNEFLVYGSFSNLMKFFKNISVDKTFMDEPNDFMIYSPMFSFGEDEYTSNLHLDQFYPMDHVKKYGVPMTHEFENITRNVLHGRWYSFQEDPENITMHFIKGIKPADFEKRLDKAFPEANKEFKDNVMMYIDFKINVENLFNALFDQESEYATEFKDGEETLKKFVNTDNDFDYTKLNVKNIDDEKEVKNSLNDIIRSVKNINSK